ncbi:MULTISPECIES: EAL domain-containing protein [unclassified Vibrio]|uniref:EAL domain-containing protein n=1 Tax=Vibrio sp. HB236076 TaxID=3232307 RepID=A0AB39HHL6_9VIBR|nr:EAL domain-containing protein [Vibrio sp. HB161653]MDP5255136.1 EAL domain-containing protein [Vibrio sp. HB161653]
MSAASFYYLKNQLEQQRDNETANVFSHLEHLLTSVQDVRTLFSISDRDSCLRYLNDINRHLLTIPGALSYKVDLLTGSCDSQTGWYGLAIDNQSLLIQDLSLGPGKLESKSVFYQDNNQQFELSLPALQEQLQVNPMYIKPSIILTDGSVISLYDDVDLVLKKVYQSESYPFYIESSVTISGFYQFIFKSLFGFLALSFIPSVLISFQLYRWFNSPNYLAKKVLKAIHLKQIQAYIQPIHDSANKIHGGEILVRWQHPLLGLVYPDEFIDLVEKSGTANYLTAYLMDEFTVYGLKNKERLDQFHLSFNITAQQLTEYRIIEQCERFIRCFSQEQISLVLELTEREQVNLTPDILEHYKKLKSIDVSISIDDFGTGTSSLTYLQMFDVDFIKIDKSFVDLINSSSQSNHIIHNMLDLTRRLNIPTVAEGVENEAQRDFLVIHGVDCLQGYFYSKAIPLDTFFEDYF